MALDHEVHQFMKIDSGGGVGPLPQPVLDAVERLQKRR
jgi:hypothetical protein